MKAVLKKILKKIISERFHKAAQLAYSNGKIRSLQAARNVGNKIKYGKEAPVCGETVYVEARTCNKILHSSTIRNILGLTKNRASGKVISFWPLEHTLSLMEKPGFEADIKSWIKKLPYGYIIPPEYSIGIRIRSCIEHWVGGLSWQDTGIFELLQYEMKTSQKGSYDNCKNLDDIITRYNNLDLLFKQIKQEGRLRTQEEINPNNYRKRFEVLFHIGPYGKTFFGGAGCHRFAIAYILKLKFPATIGLVYKSAIPFLPELRKNN